MSISLVGLNPFLANLIQTGTIERMVHEALMQETLFRTDVKPEEFGAKIGETKLVTRNGLLPVSITPLEPGYDPTPKVYAKEAFRTTLQKYGDTVDMYLPHDYIAVAKESAEKSSRLAINAAQSIDRLARAIQYRAYLGGNTVATAVAAIGAVQIHVASLNGFTEINDALNGQPVVVSSTNPLTIEFGGTEPDNTVTAFVADDPLAPFGPGWLTLGSALTAGVAAREAVLAENRSALIIAGGGNTVDAIGAGDTLTMTDLINAATSLRASPKVPTFGDGLYHSHISPYGEGQLLLDPIVRGLLQSDKVPEIYRKYAIGELGGVLLLRNSESPDSINAGNLVSTGAGASQCAPEIGGEVVNNAGIRIGYTFVYGEGCCYEEYQPPGSTAPEVNIAKTEVAASAMSSGITLNTDRIEFILRPPFDRMNDMHSFSWKFVGDFVCASDITTSARRFRRGAIIAHAIG